MKNIINILLAVTLLASCTKSAPEQTEEVAVSDAIVLTDDQLAFNQIKTGKLAQGELYHVVKATGTVNVPPNSSLKLSTPIEAYVSKIMVLPGDWVEKNQPVAELTHPSIAQTQKEYLTVKAQLEFIKKDIQRKSELLEGKSVSQRTFDQLKSEEVNMQTQLKSLESELQRLGINKNNLTEASVTQTMKLRAPISGVITEVFSKTGEHLATANFILSILNNDHEHIELQIFQEDLGKMAKGMNVRLRLPGVNELYQGKVFLINTQLNQETLSANVHVHPDEEWPHLPINAVVFAEVIYQVDSGLSLPSSEIIREGVANFVFVKTPEGFVKREVQVGFNDGQNVQIIGPKDVLKADVVLKGNYYLNGV